MGISDQARLLVPGGIAGRKASHRRSRSAPVCENEGVEKYAVVIHEEAEGGYWAEVPALPGCYSQGDSIDELMANVREAITGVLEVMRGPLTVYEFQPRPPCS